VGSAADGEQPVALAKRTAPDVVLMDTWLPRLDGVEATQLINAGAPGFPNRHAVLLRRLSPNPGCDARRRGRIPLRPDPAVNRHHPATELRLEQRRAAIPCSRIASV